MHLSKCFDPLCFTLRVPRQTSLMLIRPVLLGREWEGVLQSLLTSSVCFSCLCKAVDPWTAARGSRPAGPLSTLGLSHKNDGHSIETG